MILVFMDFGISIIIVLLVHFREGCSCLIELVLKLIDINFAD